MRHASRTSLVAGLLGWLVMTAGESKLVAQTAAPAPCSVRVTGHLPADTILTPAQLRALPHGTVRAADHGRDTADYSVVRLADVLRAAGASIGPGAKGGGVAQYIVVRAADGYRAAYSVAEVDSAMTGGALWFADQKNGGPLGPEEGPCRMLAPADRRHARWVRQVIAIEFHQIP